MPGNGQILNRDDIQRLAILMLFTVGGFTWPPFIKQVGEVAHLVETSCRQVLFLGGINRQVI